MKKWLLLLCILLFLDCQIAGSLKEKTSLKELRDAGIPVESLEKSGAGPEEMQLYRNFWKDLQYFPVAAPYGKKEEEFSFEDTWHEKRSYGGERQHEGCDVFGSQGTAGYYPVISITDGIVENVGWLPLGGWRIGIRSPGGGYFYYAHLFSYAEDFQKGDHRLLPGCPPERQDGYIPSAPPFFHCHPFPACS